MHPPPTVHSTTQELVKKFLDFFEDKIAGVRLKFAGFSASVKFLYPSSIPSILKNFLPVANSSFSHRRKAPSLTPNSYISSESALITC